MRATNVLVMGAAGRDFHTFNICYRGNPRFKVVAFTAAQIPGIEERRYPPELAGRLYPQGIPIYPETQLEDLIKEKKVDLVVFAYSDVSLDYIKEREDRVKAQGARFLIPDPFEGMIPSRKPVISICAVRTGSGKSQTAREVVNILRENDVNPVVIRHPMPYGDLRKQAVQRFATLADLEKHNCSIEEMEEYEPHLKNRVIVYAGVDYGKILRRAEKEKNSDLIIWDGGNNDTPFYNPDFHIVLVDPHRPGHEITYWPGKANFEMANVLIINKMDTAEPQNVAIVEENIRNVNPKATVIYANSPPRFKEEELSLVQGKRVVAVEDGPTVTHGGMPYGAGYLGAKMIGAGSFVDIKPYAVGSIQEILNKYDHLLTGVLPAMGYGEKQLSELEQTINALQRECDVVVVGTPIDLKRILPRVSIRMVRVTYEFEDYSKPSLEETIINFWQNLKRS